MPNLETAHTFKSTLEETFKGISNYEQYVKYIPGVTQISVLPPKEKGSKCQVRYDLQIIKTFYYVLNMFEEPSHKIYWTLDDSNLMKKNNGSWELKSHGTNETTAVYALDVAFKGLVPSAVTDKIAASTLPGLFAGMQKLIDSIK